MYFHDLSGYKEIKAKEWVSEMSIWHHKINNIAQAENIWPENILYLAKTYVHVKVGRNIGRFISN